MAPPLLALPPAHLLSRGLDGPDARRPPHTVYILGRLLSYCSILGIFVLLYLLARRLGLSRLWGLVAVSLMTEFRIGLDYCASYRPDAPKTFFALLALWIAARARPTRRSVLAALACLYVSFWFKPTAWAVAVILGVWVWRAWGGRRALAVALAFVVAGLVPVFLLDRHWNGLLLLNIVDSLANGFTLANYTSHLRIGFLTPALILFLGAGFAAAGLWPPRLALARLTPDGAARPSDLGTGWLILAAAPAALLANMFQFLKVGADVNYFLDGYVLAVLGFCWFAARLWRGEIPLKPALRDALLALGFVPLLITCGLYLAIVRDEFAPGRYPWSETAIETEARQTPGLILTAHPFIALANGQPTILDYVQYGILCRRGRIAATPLLDRLRACQFSEILIADSILDRYSQAADAGAALFDPQFVPILHESYSLRIKIGPFSVFAPRTPAPTPPPAPMR